MIRFYQLCYAPHARQQCEVHIHGHNLLQSNLPSCSMGMAERCGKWKIVEYLENAPCGAKKSIRDKKEEENTQVFDGFLAMGDWPCFKLAGFFQCPKTSVAQSIGQWVGTHCPQNPPPNRSLGLHLRQAALQVVHHVIEFVHLLGLLLANFSSVHQVLIL